MPLLAQMKTNFTKEVRPANSKPTGLVPIEKIEKRNEVDVKVPKKTRGVERYDKLNIFGEIIPDSFLFFRNTLNQNQKACYDAIYKALMKGEENVVMPVGINIDEMEDVIHAVNYDNPEAFWWAGDYMCWANSNLIVTAVFCQYAIESSKLQEEYEKFWKATAPLIFYASKLPDEMSKIKYVHDYICLSVEYDYEAAESNNCGGIYQTPYGAAVNYKTVCGGYAALFQYYMQQLGIPCAKIRSIEHGWNLLEINGQYYQMDVTWNDGGSSIPHYYNITTEEIEKAEYHMPWSISEKIVASHPATSDKMSYKKYYGDVPIGSPYTYEELNNFDYEKDINDMKDAKIFTKDTNNTNDTYDDYGYYDDDQTNNVSPSGYSIYFTLGGGKADNAKKVAESFANVSSVTVNNLDKGRFEFVVSVKDDSEIRPSLAKKLVQGGFDLYEITCNKDGDSSKTNKNSTSTSAPKIGDKGPGGGIVFYIEGKKAYECSDIIGEDEWEEAKALCKKYRGGGKSDWYLPTLEQLNQIYKNLRKTKKISDDKRYWSSTPDSDKTLAIIQDFSDGEQWTNFLWVPNSIRAVRVFEY